MAQRDSDKFDFDDGPDPTPSSIPLTSAPSAPLTSAPSATLAPVTTSSAPVTTGLAGLGQANSIMSTSGLKNAMGSATNAVGARATMAFSKTKDLFMNASTKVIVYTTLGLVITAAIAVWMYFVVANYALNQKMLILPETEFPLLGTHQTVASGVNIPGTGNGQRLTFAFWIYINNMATYANLYRHVLHRGDPGIMMSSPLVYIDKNTNKLVVRFETNSAATVTGQPKSMSQPFIAANNITSTTDTNATMYTGLDSSTNVDDNKIALDLLTRGITIDYVPLQRWVHVAVVVNEQSSKGTISAFVDAELVKQLSSQQTTFINVVSGGGSATINPNYSFQNLILDKGGNVYVGGNPMDPNIGPGFDGLVSCVTFANYDMNIKNIYDLYMRGPTGNMLAKIGYGLRSPIYKLN